MTRFRLFVADNGEDAMALPPGGRIHTIDVEVLQAALRAESAAAPALVFNLCQGVAPMLRTDYVEPFGGDGATWRGSCAALADVRAYLGVTGLGDPQGVALSGLLSVNGRQYSLQPAGRNRVRVEAVHRQAGCGNSDRYDLHPATPATGGFYDQEQPAGEVAVIDVLVLYPPATVKRRFNGDAGAARAFIAQEQAATNDIFRNSGIAARIDIVDVRECASLSKEDVTGLLFEVVESSLDSATHQWRFTRGPAWEAVRAARDEAAADLVVLLAAAESEVGGNPFAKVSGQASCIPEPARYDSSDLEVAVFSMYPTHGYVFAHELGHLLGGKHDRRTSPQRGGLSPAYDYAHGYVSDDPPFVTVMGYEQQGHLRVPAFSCADKTWNGHPLGVPLGQPGASDAAGLFRLSTRVVAGYRGSQAPRWEPVALMTACQPEIGGSVAVSGLGPYPRGAVVSVIGQPRAGFVFERWIMDGKEGPRERAISLTMDRPRALTASFVSGAERGLVLKGVGVERPDGLIASSPAGPSFTPGSEVSVVWHPGPEVPPRATYAWVVDGHLTGSASRPLNFIVEQDHAVGVIPDPARIAIDPASAAVDFDVDRLKGVLGAGLYGELELLVTDFYGRVPRFGLEFALISAPDDTRLAASRGVTDFAGRASLPVHAGNIAGELVVKVSSSEQPSVGTIVYGLIQPAVLRVRANPNEGLVEGDAPRTITLELFRFGTALGGVDIELALKENDATLLTLSRPRVSTGRDGVAVVEFSGPAHGAGQARLMAQASLPGGGRVSVSIALAVLPRRLSIRPGSTEATVVAAGERIPPLFFIVEPLGGEMTGMRATLELDGGPTGIRLLEPEVGLWGAGIGSVMLGPVSRPGRARVTIHVANAEPASMLIEVR
ncbi:M12 family metallo-peptidase [Chromobacterium sp. CV08]|uniref:M12 family metallo-peptidase n=1 Tax=Chromobacterium sp. CV08 TaxID=3133274 RepID=UPI003DAA2BD7